MLWGILSLQIVAGMQVLSCIAVRQMAVGTKPYILGQRILLTCRGIVDSILKILRPVPLFGVLFDKAGEILYGIQQYYTYTSAS